MAAEHEPVKLRRYDPSMSRRTRRPIQIGNVREEDDGRKEENDGFQRMSLEELMETEGDHDIIKAAPGRSAPAADPEKCLAVVTKQAGSTGVVGRCLKALSHLIKAKRSSKQRRTNTKFSLVQ